jgi:hypothetical protein
MIDPENPLFKFYHRLDALLATDPGAAHLQTEIGDLLTNLSLNGQSDADILAHVDPQRQRFTRTRFNVRFYAPGVKERK